MNRKFLENLIFLAKKMCDIYNVKPIDQDALYEVRSEIYEAGRKYNRAHRHKQILMPVLIILALLGLAWLVYSILF